MNIALSLLQKKSFWLITAGLMALGLCSTIILFQKNNSILMLDIKMNRTEALQNAKVLAEQNNWPAKNAQTAAAFEQEQMVQFFVELEGGGKKAFTELMEKKLYEPYTWHVRHFNEQQIEESHVFFTPDGTPYGFTIKLAETTEKPNLSVHQARELAQSIAYNKWAVDFSEWKEIEASKDTKPCKRIDHTFIYQKIDVTLGAEGEFRLSLIVSGDMVTQVKRSIFVPEAFNRRFEKMRSSNNVISTLGTTSFFLFYILLGCLIVGAFFYKKNLLIIRPAAYWATGFGFLAFISTLNKLPLVWMNYNTAMPIQTFLMHYFISGFSTACALGFGFTLLFSVCLTWDRLAFSKHLQFWNLWSKSMGASRDIFSLTFLGYAWAVIFLGLATLIYYILTTYVGWWGPAATITDPNILATYFPWLDAFYQSLQAGFFEEVVFRALPLAASCLIGKYFKKEHLFIVIGLIIQALIFAAVHANYPQMPGFFRLVELFIPALIFGILYLLFGLVPAIISHFIYDFFLMALPVLIDHSSNALVHKIIITLFALFPFLVLCYRRYKHGSFYMPTLEDFNPHFNVLDFFKKNNATKQIDPSNNIIHSNISLNAFSKKIIYAAGFLGLIIWINYSEFTPSTSPIEISKKQAVTLSKDIFTAKGFSDDRNWTTLPFIACLTSLQEKFIWQTQGKIVYKDLLDSYLTPPCWAVRFASFSGDIIQRAEELCVLIGPKGELLRTLVTLPESAEGALLMQGQARGIALTALEEEFNITTKDLKEISAIEQKRPARLDWTFTFQDTRYQLKAGGQARIIVVISGDKVTNITRFIFVPEEWQREEQKKETHKNLIHFVLIMMLAGLLFFCFSKIQKILFSRFYLKKSFLIIFGLFTLFSLKFFNQLTSLQAIAFKTSTSYSCQLLQVCSNQIFIILIISILLGLFLVHFKNSISSIAQLTFKERIFLGFSIQGIYLGITSIFLCFRTSPHIPDYSPFGTTSPFFTSFLTAIQSHLYGLIMITVLFAGIKILTQKNTHYLFLSYLLIFLFGSITGYISIYQLVNPTTAFIFSFINGLLLSVLYNFLFRHDDTLIVIKIITSAFFTVLYNGILQPYPHALVNGIAISIIIFILGLIFLNYLLSSLLKKEI